MTKIKLLEGFSGIGAPRMALEELGYKISDDSQIIEWNIFSIIAYASTHHYEKYIENKKNTANESAEELNQWLYNKYSISINEAGISYNDVENGNLQQRIFELYKNKGVPILSKDGKKPLSVYNLKKDEAYKLKAALLSVDNYGDIRHVKDVDNCDIFWQSSPCTNFSMSGTNSGGDEGSGTASSLLYDAIRIIRDNKPKIVVWENVTGVLNDNHIHNFNKYIETLSEYGYTSNWKAIKGTDVGFPQTRPRVFVYSYLEEQHKIDLNEIFNKTYKKQITSDIINFNDTIHENIITNIDINTPLPKQRFVDIRNLKAAKIHLLVRLEKNAKDYEELAKMYKIYQKDANETNVETKEILNYFQKRLDYNKLKDINFTFDALMSPSRASKAKVNEIGTLVTNKRVAKYCGENDTASYLTSLDYWKLMGFDEKHYFNVKNEIPDTQIYKICGNSILVPVIKEIFKLFKLSNFQ